jgi:hypothetical protein
MTSTKRIDHPLLPDLHEPQEIGAVAQGFDNKVEMVRHESSTQQVRSSPRPMFAEFAIQRLRRDRRVRSGEYVGRAECQQISILTTIGEALDAARRLSVTSVIGQYRSQRARGPERSAPRVQTNGPRRAANFASGENRELLLPRPSRRLHRRCFQSLQRSLDALSNTL